MGQGRMKRRSGSRGEALPPLAAAAGLTPDASISGLFDRFADVRSVAEAGDDTQALKKLDLSSWLASYQQEQSSYSSVSIYAETKLQEALRMDMENRPSAFRTAVCADLFFKVSELFGRYRGLMHAIGHELCASIYADYPEDRTGVGNLASNGTVEELDHSTLTPFFVATRTVEAQVTFLQTEVSELSDTSKYYVREQRNRAKAITIAQRPLKRLMLRIYFSEWVRSGANNQGRLLKIILQWKDAKAQQMMNRCIFQGWKRLVKEAHLEQTRTKFSEFRSSVSEESASLKEMLSKTKNRLDVAQGIGDNQQGVLSRVLAQFKRPGALEAMKRRR